MWYPPFQLYDLPRAAVFWKKHITGMDKNQHQATGFSAKQTTNASLHNAD